MDSGKFIIVGMSGDYLQVKAFGNEHGFCNVYDSQIEATEQIKMAMEKAEEAGLKPPKGFKYQIVELI